VAQTAIFISPLDLAIHASDEKGRLLFLEEAVDALLEKILVVVK
jgi:hypothetical protein